jgi:hypothetical protein
MIFLDGLGLAGYKSFGEEVQLMAPFKQLNLFIGKNNSGKSNILTFIYKHLQTIQAQGRTQGWKPEATDRHIGSNNRTFRLHIGLVPNKESIKVRLSKSHGGNHDLHAEAYYTVLASDKHPSNGNVSWFPYKSDTIGGKIVPDTAPMESWAKPLGVSEINALKQLRNHLFSFGQFEPSIISKLIEFISPLNASFPKPHFIPAVRSVSMGQFSGDDFSGLGLVERLAQLQNPNHDERHKRDQFNQIVSFVQTVLENYSAQIEIPYQRDTILVHMDGKVLPLTALGTGIHEVVILAAAATVIENSIVCLEEPEIHMHPTLQKKFIKYLASTSNQYFITTHSAHLVDSELASVFHVQLVDGSSKVQLVSTDHGRFSVCADLGYRASDLVQANCIIWVEGPSDRIYLNHWIKAKAGHLIEGVHYSVMFYGGALRNHLSGLDIDESVVSDFISLRRLNRNMVMVMDSDKKSASTPINSTKNRLVEEFDQGPGFAWVTEGREIENYIPSETIASSIQAIRPGATPIAGGQFSKMLRIRGEGKEGAKSPLDKIAIARHVCQSAVDWTHLDLDRRVTLLVEFIEASNDTRSR